MKWIAEHWKTGFSDAAHSRFICYDPNESKHEVGEKKPEKRSCKCTIIIGAQVIYDYK